VRRHGRRLKKEGEKAEELTPVLLKTYATFLD
jgi:hypothetical protein